MLDISFSELVVCLLVALVVLGPERLPGAARAVGRWTGKARAYMRNFTAELEREAQLSEIRKQLDETQRLLQEQSQTLKQTTNKILDEARALPHHEAPPPPVLPAAEGEVIPANAAPIDPYTGDPHPAGASHAHDSHAHDFHAGATPHAAEVQPVATAVEPVTTPPAPPTDPHHS